MGNCMSKLHPVIVLGMHRSGTGLMAQIIERSGVFMGARQESNHESTFFLKLNQWLFSQLSATWDEPRNAEFQDPVLVDQLTQALEHFLKSDGRAEYIGPTRINLYSSITDIDFPWGWKDPRNVWTASIWLKLFPDAKIVHVYRHPVDVAASLRYREQQYADKVKQSVAELGVSGFLEKVGRFQTSGRIRFLQEGFGLWEQYVSHALSLEEKYPRNFLSVCYEDLLRDPSRIAGDVIARLGASGPTHSDIGLGDLIKTKRGFAFREDPALRDFHQSISDNPLVVKLGYT